MFGRGTEKLTTRAKW